MRVILTAAVVALSAPISALAAPVSLDCRLSVQATGASQRFEIQLNEDTESASYPHPFKDSEIVRWRASFTPSKVTFASFIIDRTTLAFERRNAFMGEYKGTDFGKCSVMIAKRAF